MSTKFDPRELLERDPRLDPELLDEALEVGQQLREMEIPRKKYQIVPPFGRRIISKQGQPVDPRAVRLRGSQTR